MNVLGGSRLGSLVVGLSLILVVGWNAWAGEGDRVPPQAPYKRHEIVNARFGAAERRAMIRRAYHLKSEIEAAVVGQDRVGQATQDRVVQYLENLGSRTKDPIALHLIGLPGVGKSAILDVLERLGIPVVRIDAQAFAVSDPAQALSNLGSQLWHAINEQKANGTPLIVLFDEIDKVPELVRREGHLQEVTSPLIGLLNKFLTDGKANFPGSSGAILDLSNALVISAMNFSPEEIELFSRDALGGAKNFYDYSVDDFARFDEWLRKDPSARPKVLSRLFRSNTVSRLYSNTVIVKPLEMKDYRQIARINIEGAIKSATTGLSADKKLTVTFSEAYVDFVTERTVYAPSGARDTVIKANALTEQLINFGARLKGEDEHSLSQPRAIVLDYDAATDRAVVRVTPQYRRGKVTVAGDLFSVAVDYDTDSRSFVTPTEVAIFAPVIERKPLKSQDPNRQPTKKEIRESRFPKKQKALKGLAKKIDGRLIGQEEYSRLLEQELSSFMARTGRITKNPPFLVISGFPGIGKSALVELAAEYAEIPIARVNMQAFSSSGDATLGGFISALREATSQAKRQSKDGKIIVLLEELDKVFEIDPQTGAFVDRPVMNFVKDLLNDGVIRYRSPDYGMTTIDVRDAYNIVTMNFAVDRFGFEADPRLTTIEDVLRAWQRLKSRPADIKKVLGSMFLPETVSRIMPRFVVMKPLDAEAYEKIIELQVGQVIKNRLYDPQGRNKGQVSVKLTAEYRRYLFQESVIPSEGGRHTVLTSQQRIAVDLENALAAIPQSDDWADRPLEITLDYKPKTTTVVARAIPTDGKPSPTGGAEKRRVIYRREVSLTFPSLQIEGRIPRKRLITSVHEFGHAMTGIRLGRRFEYATVVPPQSGIGGYVKFRNVSMTANSMLAGVYATLGSRAMERIFLSEDPLSKSSVLDITAGASSDIQQATMTLWNMIYELGFDPGGGTIERTGANYATFASLSAKDVEGIGLILRDMEDYLVADLMRAHPREWYIQQIETFARIGGTTEAEFYGMIDFPFPGEALAEFGDPSALDAAFGSSIEAIPHDLKRAMEYRQGLMGTTAAENLKNARAAFESAVHERLHPIESAKAEAKAVAVAGNPCVKMLEPR